MENDERTTAAALPPWLEPDDAENIPPEALQLLYGKLEDRKVTQALEQARRTIRDGYVQGVLAAHAALAGNEQVTFKQWCEAAGINYNTAKSVVHRAEAAKQGANAPRPPAPPDPPEPRDDDDDKDEDEDKDKDEPQPKPKPPKPPVFELKFSFTDETDRERGVHIVQRVIDDGHATTYEEAYLKLGDFYAGWLTPVQQKKVS